jgi:3-deoxy-D-manno-octulosonate 8-phosphate phosphatase (KDO 8-P phosphatase)
VTLADRCRLIDALVLDVDGTLTEGQIVHGEPRCEIKGFHVRDGAGLKQWLAAGKRVAIVTGRQSAVVKVRAAELGITPVLQGVSDKAVALQAVLKNWQLSPQRVGLIGDDEADADAGRRCGLCVAVADADVEMLRIAHYVTQRSGGGGAVREAVELILKCQGRWRVPA